MSPPNERLNLSKSATARSVLETEALVVAYAMSRLDTEFLRRFGFANWRAAFSSVADSLKVAPASIKNLRDEFDPVHSNSRKGWHKRPLRPNRQRVLGQFCDTSDEALVEVVARLLARDAEVRELISVPLAQESGRGEDVAERLRTGRMAEEFFVNHSELICGIASGLLVDLRNEARGFDFGVRDRATLAIEVKGLRALKGTVLFTDHEWQIARRRTGDYWLGSV